MNNINFDKGNGLVPAIIQDVHTKAVLMLGYMNEEAVATTKKLGKVTFYSRSKQRLWTKGEDSGNFLLFKSMKLDCDNDSLLIEAEPVGPTCHTGAPTCWGAAEEDSVSFIAKLERLIQDRKQNPNEGSYTNTLFEKGINKIAQKVGEEAVELVIEAKDDNKELFLGEAADLMYHYLVLLTAKGFTLSDVVAVLKARHQ